MLKQEIFDLTKTRVELKNTDGQFYSIEGSHAVEDMCHDLYSDKEQREPVVDYSDGEHRIESSVSLSSTEYAFSYSNSLEEDIKWHFNKYREKWNRVEC